MYAVKKPNGKWMVQFRLNGKTKAVTAPTKKEAEYLARKMQFEGKQIDPVTVGTMIRKYIDSRDGILSPSTIAGYEKILRNLSIVNTPVQKLDYQGFVNSLSKTVTRRGKTTSPKSISNICGLIEASAKYAGLNLTAKRPAPRKQVVTLLEPDEIFRLVRGSDIELPVLLAMWLSLSMSEIRGLTVDSVHGEYLTVKGAVVDIDGLPVYKEANKAFDRTRTLRIPPMILHLIHQTDAWKAGTGYLVPMTGQTIYKHWRRMQDTMTFHQLRHLNASIMMALGVPDTYAMERGGWSSRQTLNRVYQHTLAGRISEYDDRIDGFFGHLVENLVENQIQK